MYQKEYTLKRIKNKNNGEIVLLSNIFDNIETTIENVKYTIKDNSDNLKIILESENMDNKELDEVFCKLYEYINIVIGYYPELLSDSQVDVTCLTEKYKTGEKHIYNDVCFICKTTRNKFSHASKEIKDKAIFDGNESAFYLYKLMLVFRLLIIDEIGLDKLVNEELLKKLITNIDLWKCKMLINHYLNKKGENDG